MEGISETLATRDQIPTKTVAENDIVRRRQAKKNRGGKLRLKKYGDPSDSDESSFDDDRENRLG